MFHVQQSTSERFNEIVSKVERVTSCLPNSYLYWTAWYYFFLRSQIAL